MLGRTANDLFWLSRYMERAENMARLIEVGYRIGLIPRAGGGQCIVRRRGGRAHGRVMIAKRRGQASLVACSHRRGAKPEA